MENNNITLGMTYFKEMFDGIDKNIVLDNDQINIIKDESDSLIVVAGAGSGKTTTMAAKAKYLIDSNKYKNNEILIISYTNKAVNEISYYINNKFELNIDIMTFHKLALNILKNNNIKVKIMREQEKKKILKELIIKDNEFRYIIKEICRFKEKGNLFEKNIDNVDKLTSFCIECIDYLKTKGINELNIDNYFNNILKNANKNKYTNIILYIIKIYKTYQNYCNNNDLYSFDDLIIKCLKYINNVDLSYKYIIIDEYQDISKIRYDIVKKFSKFCKITVVGDDWQSIYSFSGSEIKYFLNFEKDMNAKILKIEKTYRNSYDLIKIAGNFVMKDNALIKKNLKSEKNLKNPIIFIYYKKNFNIAFEKSIIKIVKEFGYNKKILVLGRFKNDIEMIDSSKFIIKNNKITYILNRNIKIVFMTIHASKGLGFDNVILINIKNDEYGFPSLIENNFFKKHFFMDTNNINEERRLLYVALTRTKNRVYIICPFSKKKRSCFIKEIK